MEIIQPLVIAYPLQCMGFVVLAIIAAAWLAIQE